MKHEHSHAKVVHDQKKRNGYSGSFLLVSLMVVGLIGFVLGTRSDVLLSIAKNSFNLPVSTATLDTSALQQAYRNLEANYDGELDDEKLAQYAAKGMVDGAGDEYTKYYTPEEAEKFNNELHGNIGGGIGAEMGKRNDKITVIRTLEGPAKKAGVLAGDIVVGVDGKDVVGMSLDEVIMLIRGEIGEEVKISFARDGDLKEFTIKRQEIVAPDVEHSVKNGIGVITISRFDTSTGEKVRAIAEDFRRQSVDGVVLDLRSNGGGYLDAGVTVANVWLKKGQVIVTQKSGGKVESEQKATDDPILHDIPTIVLINGASASASEIVTGALKDHNVAKIYGEKTYGKGSVQKVLELTNGAQMKITTARWHTPKGKNISKEGITPNTEVKMTADDYNEGKDPQMDAARDALQKQ